MKPEVLRKLVLLIFLALLVAGGGAVLVTMGIRSYNEKRAFRAQAWVADGTVTGFEAFNDPDSIMNTTTEYAMVRFELEDGEKIRFRGPSRKALMQHRPGDSVHVLYNPADPSDARVDSFLGLWFVPVVYWVTGGLGVLIPLLAIWQAWGWAVQSTPTDLHAGKPLPWER